MPPVLLLFLMTVCGDTPSAPGAERTPGYRLATDFHTAVAQPLTATWDNVPLRSLLNSLADNQRVGMLLDRRIDPTITVRLSLQNQSLVAGVQQIADPVDGEPVLVGNTVFVGPAEPTRWLRTAVAGREAELAREDSGIPELRQFALWNRQTIAWEDLTTPREILAQIAGVFDLKLRNPEVVPHDLWAAATIPHATAAEALLCVLIQQDLDFRWDATGQAITIVPFQEPELIERSYRQPNAAKAREVWRGWQEAWPDLQGKVVGTAIVVSGRIEDHDRLQSPAKATTSPAAETAPPPLRRRKWTLRTENVPVVAIMRELEKSGVKFQYDAAAFRTAGIDLESRISLNVQQASSDEFFQQLFESVRVKFTIDDLTVRLEPAIQPM